MSAPIFADVEIIEKSTVVDGVGIIPNDVRINGVSYVAAYEPIEVGVDPEKLVSVTLTLYVNSLSIHAEPKELPEFRPTDKFPDLAYVRRMTGRA